MPLDFKLSRVFRSPHFSPSPVSPEFVVLHYTAQSLAGTLNIFLSPEGLKVSCHLLIDEKGEVYELVRCLTPPCQKAFHAGRSRQRDARGRFWRNFNDFSIGIELVNLNGNVFPYTEEQYRALFKVIEYLKSLYPNLKIHGRILGHEHIAGFRGKADPGGCFDWQRLYRRIYNEKTALSSKMTQKRIKALEFCRQNKDLWDDSKARRISLILEKPLLPFRIKRQLIKRCLLK